MTKHSVIRPLQRNYNFEPSDTPGDFDQLMKSSCLKALETQQLILESQALLGGKSASEDG